MFQKIIKNNSVGNVSERVLSIFVGRNKYCINDCKSGYEEFSFDGMICLKHPTLVSNNVNNLPTRFVVSVDDFFYLNLFSFHSTSKTFHSIPIAILYFLYLSRKCFLLYN